MTAVQRYVEPIHYAKSVLDYTKANSLSPSFGNYRNLVLGHYMTNNCPKAIEALDAAISIDQQRVLSDRDPMLVGVRCFTVQGKFEVSRNLLGILLQNQPDVKTDTEFVKAGLYLRKKMQHAQQ